MFTDPLNTTIPDFAKTSLDFRVPAPQQMFPENEQEPLISRSKLQVTKLLLVEELLPMREHMLGLLKRIIPGEHKVVTVVDPTEAQVVAVSFKPEVMIVDSLIGTISGFHLADKISADSGCAKILFWSREYKCKHLGELAKVRSKCTSFGYILKTDSDEKLAHAIESIVIHDNPFLYPAHRSALERCKPRLDELTENDLEILKDVAIGLTDKAISIRRHISVRGVQNKISILLSKLLKGECGIVNERTGIETINQRLRLVHYALLKGLIGAEDIQEHDTKFLDWLETKNNAA